MLTSPTSPGATPARSSAALIAAAPRRGAGTEDRAPRKLPIAVRAAPTRTTSRMRGAYRCRRGRSTGPASTRGVEDGWQNAQDVVDLAGCTGPAEREPYRLAGLGLAEAQREQDRRRRDRARGARRAGRRRDAGEVERDDDRLAEHAGEAGVDRPADPRRARAVDAR